MTSTTSGAPGTKKYEWLVILPDQPDKLDTRMKVRPDHLKNLQPGVDAGLWTFGGAFLEAHPAEGERPKAKGSVMLASASSEEEVLEALKKDVYTKGGVWDWDQVQILPFRSAIRKAL